MKMKKILVRAIHALISKEHGTGSLPAIHDRTDEKRFGF